MEVEEDDEVKLHAYATALADGIEAALPAWVRSSVERVLEASGTVLDPDAAGRLAVEVDAAGEAARIQVGGAVRSLLDTDVDAQRTNPMAILRAAVDYPTRLLAQLGVPPLRRDAVAREQFPDDVYDLTPGGFADLDPELRDAGIAWGAAKAHVVLARRRREGLR